MTGRGGMRRDGYVYERRYILSFVCFHAVIVLYVCAFIFGRFFRGAPGFDRYAWYSPSLRRRKKDVSSACFVWASTPSLTLKFRFFLTWQFLRCFCNVWSNYQKKSNKGRAVFFQDENPSCHVSSPLTTTVSSSLYDLPLVILTKTRLSSPT